MHEDDDKVRIELPKCENPDCVECAHHEGYFEGTVQEALQRVSDDALERDRVLMELITEQAHTIVTLYRLMEALAPGDIQVVTIDLDDTNLDNLSSRKNDKLL